MKFEIQFFIFFSFCFYCFKKKETALICVSPLSCGVGWFGSFSSRLLLVGTIDHSAGTMGLLMGRRGGECPTHSVLSTSPSYSFIFSHPPALPLPLLSAFFDAANQALHHFRWLPDSNYIQRKTLFDVFCVFLPLACYSFHFNNPHPPALPLETPQYEARHTHSGAAASVLQGELFPGTCYY